MNLLWGLPPFMTMAVALKAKRGKAVRLQHFPARLSVIYKGSDELHCASWSWRMSISACENWATKRLTD